MSTPEEHLSASLKFQEYYDATLRKVGLRAPQPVLGQTVNDYRRETLRTIKRTFLPQNHPLYGVQMRQLKADALQALEPQVLQAAVVEANNPVHVPAGELRKVEELDDYGKLKTIKWIGPRSFVYDMMRPGRRTTLRQMQQHAEQLIRMVK